MAEFNKHRLTRDSYGVDYNNRLVAPETVDTINIVKVERWIYNNWYDRTSEFMLASGIISSGVVVIILEDAASETQQIPSIYRILTKVTTSAGRELVETCSLKVFDTFPE